MRVDRRKKKLFCSPQSYILMLILPPIHTITEKKQNGVDRGAGGKGRKKRGGGRENYLCLPLPS